jgi:hypothetical protein
VKDTQRRKHGAMRGDQGKSCRPELFPQGRWRFEFDVVAPRSSTQAFRELANLRKLPEAVQSPLIDVCAEVNPARL